MEELIENFLTDLGNANRAALTIKNYRADLRAFTARNEGIALADITVEILRDYFVSQSGLSAATRARRQSSLAALFRWARRLGHIKENPMELLDRVRLPAPAPRGVGREAIMSVLKAIPADRIRDRLLFRLLLETGLRVGEAVSLQIEDIDLTLDDEHLFVVGKGGKRRTILLDDGTLVVMLRKYLKETGYRYGHLFRAGKNARSASISYEAVGQLWRKYCDRAGVKGINLHKLRHTHATELINDGVPLTTIGRRLGHSDPKTTTRYAVVSDRRADEEIRARRRAINHSGRGND